MECRLSDIVTLKGAANFLVIGDVVGMPLRDDAIRDGIFDVLSFEPLARLGYRDYSRVREVFSLNRPGD